MSARPAGMASWGEFAWMEPEMAALGRALLVRDYHGAWPNQVRPCCAEGSDVAMGFLASVGRGEPHLAPVCPIFCDGSIYLSVGAGTPKRRDLDLDGRYVLHAFLGPQDAEFQITGAAERVDDEPSRRRVQEAIPFAAFGRTDPIYRLWVRRCLYGYWENVGKADTRPVRRWWRAQTPRLRLR